jgi:hypothetical protein
MTDQAISPRAVLVWVAVVLGVVILLLAAGLGGCAGLKAFNRAQARADAHNGVALTQIQIQNQRQYAQVIAAHNNVVRQQAYQRFLEAVGIRRAQDEISKTLTPLYIQHEAIQALQAIANSGRNNTVVYVPAGPNGVPIVNLGTKP